MPIKFYTDAHIARAVITQAIRRNVDIVRCEDVGMAEAKDEMHLEYATAQGRTIVTADSDFSRLHSEWLAAGKPHAGIIRVQQKDKDNIGMIVDYLVALHELIEGGAGNVEQDVFNQIFYL